MILMIDNYDSFTYNLVHSIAVLGEEVVVRRNDAITLEEIGKLRPAAIFLSPGPCTPKEGGITVEVIKRFSPLVPIMGVCLGHQAIGYAFGGEVARAKRLMHGKTSLIIHDDRTIFRGLANPFEAIRYHSLIVDKERFPECLEITAWTEEGEIMGLRHREYQVEGVQFHPESILTPLGGEMIRNFVQSIHEKRN
jgi:anthranilate synthase/aminodeoxychorismate synthase-like glutamine amidotransferase